MDIIWKVNMMKMCNGSSDQCKSDCSENIYKEEKEKVAYRLDTLLEKRSKFKKLPNNPEIEKLWPMKDFMTGT